MQTKSTTEEVGEYSNNHHFIYTNN